MSLERKQVSARSAVCVALFSFSSLCAGSGCGPLWVYNPELGKNMAAKENKPLLLYFRAWDSTQHRNMLREVFANPAVKSELTGTVNVELEFAFFKKECAKYGVQRPQVCVMCTPQGEKIGTPIYVNPVPAPEKFLEWMREVKALASGKPPPETTPK